MDLQLVLEQRAKVEEFQRKHRVALLTLVFTDLVGSTQLKEQLGEAKGIALIQQYRAAVRQLLADFKEAEEIETAGDSFFLVFAKPSDAARFSLTLQSKLRGPTTGIAQPLPSRIAIHVGEVFIEEHDRGGKAKDLYGLQVDICARVMSLAEGNQILLTRSAFDNARQVLKGQEVEGLNKLNGLQWLNHGPYLLKGVEEPLEICEVGEVGQAVLKAPPDSEKVTIFRLLKERLGNHSKIVGVQDVHFDAPPFYIVMDYAEGQNLRSWCESQWTRVPLDIRLEIIAQAAEALQAAHGAGVIHRDVKPSNILISTLAAENRDSKFEVRLTDFGIGQVMSEEYLAGLTRAGFTDTLSPGSSAPVGTLMYLAPELLAGQPASPRSDTYSLGVVLYQLLIGDFSQPLTIDWAKNKKIGDPFLKSNLEKCFAGDPSERFDDVGQLATNLRTLLKDWAEEAKQNVTDAAQNKLLIKPPPRTSRFTPLCGSARIADAAALEKETPEPVVAVPAQADAPVVSRIAELDISEPNPSSPVLNFYRRKGRDSSGRNIDEVLNWGYERLEDTSDYIQWLFPLREKSEFSASAPTLSEAEIRAFQNDENLRKELTRSLDVMLSFYGFARQGQGQKLGS